MPKCYEFRIVFGALAVFSVWIFVALPLLYGAPSQVAPPHLLDDGYDFVLWGISGGILVLAVLVVLAILRYSLQENLTRK